MPGEPGIKWELTESGQVNAARLDSREALVAHRMFWFAWYSFHVDTLLYDGARGD